MTELSVYGFGMVTALGFNGPASCAALRAGVVGLEDEQLFWDYTAGEHFTAARPKLPQWWQGRGLLAHLVAPAINECVAKASTLRNTELALKAIPFFLTVAPPQRPGRWPDLDARLMDDVRCRLRQEVSPLSRLVPHGRTGLVYALAEARKALEDGHEFCIVAGVESFLQQRILNHYVGERRAYCGANSNGFRPGEASSALLIALRNRYRAPELKILGIGLAQDPSGAGGTAQYPVTGDGLTTATKQALSQAGRQFAAIDLRLSDANGEHFKFKEVVFANNRLFRPRPAGMRPRRFGVLEHWHPIEGIGEVGAAIMPALLGCAFDAGTNDELEGPLVLAHAGEDNGERAAVIAEFTSNRSG
jgi:3-oxoacyl-[acyl-carrier-protein] synthase-1